MNLFYKNRLIFWLLLILAVINVSALATYFIFREKPAAPAEECCADGTRPCTILKSELGLTDAQEETVVAINRTYTDSAGPVVAAIKNTRAEILTALDETETDPVKLDRLVEQLGELQVKLQKASMIQYRELRRVCTPEQAHRLSALYRDLYGCPLNSDRGNHRYRHGQGGRCN